MNSVNSYEDSSMETVELHRAESLVEPPDDLDAIIEKHSPEEKQQKLPTITPVNTISIRLSNLCAVIKDMKVEMVMFLYMFSYIIRSVSSTSMILDKVCLSHLGYPLSVCQNVSHYPSIKILAEKMATNYNLGYNLIHLVPAAILGIFIGAWSDKYGRKLPITVALIGIILDGLGSTVCAALLDSRVEYYYIATISTGLSGGLVSVFTVLYSYASDTSSVQNRTMKYAFMEVCFGLALPVGGIIGGWVYRYSGYVPVFMISTTGHVLALIWTIFVLKETRGLDNKESWRRKMRNFWSTESVIESFRTTIKIRPNKGREQVLLLIMSMSVCIFNSTSSASVSFIYAHHLYDWDNTKYSTISAVVSVFYTIVLLIIVPVFKRFNLGDAVLGLMGSISLMLRSIGIGLATTEHIYYFANFLGMFSGLISLAGRSRISKVVSKAEIGKVFSFLTSAEAILPIFTSVLVTLIFNKSLEFFPGLIFLLIGVLMLNPVVVFIWLRKIPVESEQTNTEDEEIQNPNSLGLGQESIPKKGDDSKEEPTAELKRPTKY